MMKRYYSFWILLLVLSFAACRNEAPVVTAEPKTPIQIPAVNADSLLANVEKQLSFGYRVPGTEGHLACKNWLVSHLESLGAKVEVQKFKASFLGQNAVDAYNIIASINPDHQERVLLAAHWDSRLIAEKDADDANRAKPIKGANDGASGVAVLLEIARMLQSHPIDMGVDIILFDAEDQGYTEGGDESVVTWCLGSQYWANNKHDKKYKANFGILLDMVGAKGAVFGREGVSMQFAQTYMDKTWKLAQRMGYGAMFVDKTHGSIQDDHYYVNAIAGIPMLDIIHWDFSRNSFGHYHHTQDDDLDVIDKQTLKIVGQVVTAVLYKESEGSF